MDLWLWKLIPLPIIRTTFSQIDYIKALLNNVTMNEIREKMTQIFRTEFDDPDIMLNDNTSANDITGWDSLKHVSLVLAVEREFGIRFSPREVLGVRKHLDIEELIAKKIGSK